MPKGKRLVCGVKWLSLHGVLWQEAISAQCVFSLMLVGFGKFRAASVVPPIATQAACARVFLRARGWLYKVSNSVSSTFDVWFGYVFGCCMQFRLHAPSVFACQEGCAELCV
ncbi:MAG: hypothetical protein D8H98_12160 [Prevotella sp.]|nr:MAG: hypothetical protein D8H98_12160 [Prevotella sp.]